MKKNRRKFKLVGNFNVFVINIRKISINFVGYGTLENKLAINREVLMKYLFFSLFSLLFARVMPSLEQSSAPILNKYKDYYNPKHTIRELEAYIRQEEDTFFQITSKEPPIPNAQTVIFAKFSKF